MIDNTARDAKIRKLLSQGLTRRVIAERMRVSLTTVQNVANRRQASTDESGIPQLLTGAALQTGAG